MKVLVFRDADLATVMENVDTVTRDILDRAAENGRNQQALLKNLSLPQPDLPACEVAYCDYCLKTEAACRCHIDDAREWAIRGQVG